MPAAKPTDRRSALDRARAAVQKSFKGAVSGCASDTLEFPKLWLPTGSLVLDRVIRGFNPGGIPMGKLVHIGGDPSTGKSLIVDHLFKNCAAAGGASLCSDFEGRDPYFAQQIGLDLNSVEIQQPETFAQACDWGLKWCHAMRKELGPEVPLLWVTDSVDGANPNKLSGRNLSDDNAYMYGAGKPEEIGTALRKITNQAVLQLGVTVVMINQVRIDPRVSYGPNRYTPGGNALHFYAGVELMLSVSPLGSVRDKYRGAKISAERRKQLGLTKTEKGDVIGRWIRVLCTKNKCGGTMYDEGDFFLSFIRGLVPGAGLLSKLLTSGVCHQEGEKIKHMVPGHDPFMFANEKEWGQWLMANQELALHFDPRAAR